MNNNKNFIENYLYGKSEFIDNQSFFLKRELAENIENELKKVIKSSGDDLRKNKDLLEDLTEELNSLKIKKSDHKNIQEIKSEVNARKSILNVYTDVINNLISNVLQHIPEKSKDNFLYESFASSIEPIIKEIYKELNNLPESIKNWKQQIEVIS